jgi:hypothetical protein
MRDGLFIDSIHDYKLIVFRCFIKEGGWTRYKQTHRANSVNLVNKHSKKTRNPNMFCAQLGQKTLPVVLPPSEFGIILKPKDRGEGINLPG